MGKPIFDRRPDRPLDLVLVLDGTGSMGPWLRELRRQWPAVLRGLNTLPGLRLGAVAFQGHADAEYVTRIHEPSYLLSETTGFLDHQLAVGGGSGGEALECGLRAVADLTWRQNARKQVVLIGDRPPHSGTCPHGVDWRDEVERLVAAGVELCTVRVGGCLDAQRSFEYMAARTAGTFLDQPHIRALPPALIGLARRTAAGLGRSRALLRV